MKNPTHVALSQLFSDARSIQKFSSEPVSDELLQRVQQLSQFGPTAFNCQPARYLFIRSATAKARLAPALSSGNRDKTLAAPVSVVIAWDTHFYEHLPLQFPAYDAKAFFERSPEWIEPSGKLSATLQAGYFIIAARGAGLDVGPMSGFKSDLIDREFFADGRYRSFLLLNLGYRDAAGLQQRNPRLGFEDVAQIV